MKKDRNLQRDSLDFRGGKIPALFRAILIPTLIAMFFNMALTVIDGVFVGQGVGAAGIAAVNIVVPMYMITTGIAMMFSVGASVIASIRLSENNVKAANIIMTQAFIAGTLCVGMLCLLMTLFTRPIVEAMGATPHIIDDSMAYMLWMQPGILLLGVQYVGMMLIRLDGSPRYAMWIQVVSAVLNIFLDWLLVFPFGMGVSGAAIATSFSCVVGGCMALLYFLKFSNTLHFYRLKTTLTSLLLSLRNTGYMAKIGFATLLTELAMSIMILTGNLCFKKLLGDDGVAAFAIACYLFPLVFSIGNAVAQSAQPIMSFNYGAHLAESVRNTLRIALVTAGLFGAAITVALALFSGPVSALFLSTDEPAYLLAKEGLPVFGICAVFFSLNVTFIGYYQNIERPGISTLYTVLRGIVLLVPAFILLPGFMGTHGLWFAIPLAEIITCAIIIAHYKIAGNRFITKQLPGNQES